MAQISDETSVDITSSQKFNIKATILRYHRWVVFFAYLIATLIITHPLLFSLNEMIFGPSLEGDNFWAIWSLWWFKRAGEVGQSFDRTNYIYGLLPSVPNLVQGHFNHFLAFPLQWFVSPLGAFNIGVLLSFVLSGFTMYLLVAEFVHSKLACFVAGFIYDFSAYHFYRADAHIGLMTLQWLPFFVWRVFIFYLKPDFKNATLTGLGLALVAFSDIYYIGYFAIPFAGLFLIGKLIVERKWFKQPQHWWLSAWALVFGLLLIVPVFTSYFSADPELQSYIKGEAQQTTDLYSADLVGFVLPLSYNPILGKLTEPTYQKMRGLSEQVTFLGYINLLLGLGAFAFRRNRRRNTFFWFILGLGGVLLALGPKLYIAGQSYFELPFYKLIFGWPLLDTFRTPSRLVILPLIGLAILSAYTLEAAFSYLSLKKFFRIVPAGLAAILVILSLTEQILWAFPYPSTVVPVPSLYYEMANDKVDGMVLDLPPLPAGSYQYYQTIHHRRMVTGFSQRITPTMTASIESVPDMPRFFNQGVWLNNPGLEQRDIFPVTANFARGLQENNIRYVLLHSNKDPNLYSWYRGFLESNLGKPFYDKTEENLVAWRIEPGPPPDPGLYHLKMGSGWLPARMQLQNGWLQRAIGQSAQLYIYSPRAQNHFIGFVAVPYFKPATLEVRLNGIAVKRVDLAKAWNAQRIEIGPVKLNQGENILEFVSLTPCSYQTEFNPSIVDLYCYSMGLQQVQLAY